MGKIPKNHFIYIKRNKPWYISNLVYFALDPEIEMNLNKDEVSATFWCPLNDFFKYKGSRLFSKIAPGYGFFYFLRFFKKSTLDQVTQDFDTKSENLHIQFPFFYLHNEYILFGITMLLTSSIIDLMQFQGMDPESGWFSSFFVEKSREFKVICDDESFTEKNGDMLEQL